MLLLDVVRYATLNKRYNVWFAESSVMQNVFATVAKQILLLTHLLKQIDKRKQVMF